LASKMKNTPPWVLYVLYFLAVTAVLLYMLFPADTVKRYVESLGSRLDPALQTTVDRVRPAFPASVRLSGIRLRYNRRLLFGADRATVSPRLMAYLAGKRGYTLRCETYGGRITARLEIASDQPAGRIRIDALDLSKIPLLQGLGRLKPAGRLDLAVDFRTTDGVLTGKGGFHVRDLKVHLEEMVPAAAELSFASVDGKLRLEGKQLTITGGRAKGRQADAAIQGSLNVTAPFTESGLDLSLTLRPHAEFIAALRKDPSLRWLSAGMAGSRGLPLRIFGTIEKPQVAVQ